MLEIQLFESPQFGQLRTIVLPDGQMGFVGKDVATALGYANQRKALIDHVDTEDKTDGVTIRDSIGRKQTPTIINESGLYSLVLSSKLPQARQFKRWVTSEVLPQIRQTGGYIPVREDEDETEIMSRALLIAQKTIERKDALLEAQRQKVEYCEKVLTSPSCFTMTQIAKDLSMTVYELTRRLLEKGVIYHSQSGPYMLYAKYLGNGYESYRTRKGEDLFGNVVWTDNYLVWTERGREFIHSLIHKR